MQIDKTTQLGKFIGILIKLPLMVQQHVIILLLVMMLYVHLLLQQLQIIKNYQEHGKISVQQVVQTQLVQLSQEIMHHIKYYLKML
jgi:hypothetical protein